MPNAETIEIDEDDDILSIMDTIYRPDPSGFADANAIESDDAPILDIETAPEVSLRADGHKPIVVTAKSPIEEAAKSSNNANSNLVVFVVAGLIAAAIVVAVFYYFSQPSIAP